MFIVICIVVEFSSFKTNKKIDKRSVYSKLLLMKQTNKIKKPINVYLTMIMICWYQQQQQPPPPPTTTTTITSKVNIYLIAQIQIHPNWKKKLNVYK